MVAPTRRRPRVGVVAFDSAEAYEQFMGRFSRPLATEFADLLGVGTGVARALDVGCGPGALTAELVRRLGADRVSAVDPSGPFLAAVRRDHPGVRVDRASAEELPYDDATFDLVLCQLVVHFMTDPVAGLAELARVVAPGGTVAANVWDFGGGRGPVSPFWRAARELDPAVTDESGLPGVGAGSLTSLFEQAGMTASAPGEVTITVTLPGFDDYWRPFTRRVGPAGEYLASLDVSGQEALQQRCRTLLPGDPVTIRATAWTATWRRPA